ncbi:DUF418 domain-containing protein [Pseudoalteromonas sp. MMG024]|uniref:DUF418 domain-containing protein n=1 Tax=Pseudoalteromonas sp. MMG024 TaxID=2909980 RepID=UPI001F20B4AC|nr:DUF418 domain-containing protein [Pseudoalteromonas sp. MMG024]MCF6458602.1 DUF418 domain-containing protein [Pseudoalteromonas sp. MMG024]
MKPTQRDPLLDIFRGFAIFGIFFINITIMHCLFINQDAFSSQFQDTTSEVINRVLQLFFYNKFFPIFSFLFGFGITSQIIKKQLNNKTYLGFFTRRMSALFVIGALHISLFWSGDVLHLYAILGLLSLAMVKLNVRVLSLIAVGLLVFPFYDNLAKLFLKSLETPLDKGLLAYGEQGIISTLREGTYFETIQLRFHEYMANLPMLLFYLAPMAFAMFTLGIAAGKSTLTLGSKQWLAYFKNPAIFALVLTSIYRVVFLFWLPESDLYRQDLLRPLWFKLMFLSDITFGLCYLWTIAWLWHRVFIKRLLMQFSYVGRLALSNYILHSVIGLFLFTNLGLSLYQTLSPLMCFVIALMSFVLQSLLSKWWLTHFQYGPLEWAWRRITYKQKMPFRRVAC